MCYPKLARRLCGGFSLLELIIVLAISTITFGIAFPSANQFSGKLKVRTEQNELLTLIKTARAEALSANAFIAVCHLSNDRCEDFSSPLTIFTDRNNNRILDSDEATKAIFHLSPTSQISWNKTKRMRFSPTGRALNGSLKYCRLQSTGVEGFKIIVARTGRIRTEFDAEHCD